MILIERSFFLKKWKIGYTSGTFDLLHKGHLNIIHRAKEQCDSLIVAVSTDDLCMKYKGIYPYQSLQMRMHAIEKLEDVDEVVIQSTMDKIEAYQKYHFNVVFVGDDWKGTEKWNGIKKKFDTIGVEIVFFPYTPNISSSMLRETIRKYGLLYNEESNSYSVSKYTGVLETNLVIPDNFCGIEITEIMPCALSFHVELQNVYLPDTIRIIGTEAFYGCTSLQRIRLSDNIHTIGIGAFAECSQLQDITLPTGLKVLNSDLFYHCCSLTNIVLPENIEIIRENAVRGAEQLLHETDSVLYLGKWCISSNDHSQSTVHITDGTIGIADAAFLNHPCIENIRLPSSIKHVGIFAFDGTPLWNSKTDGEVVYADHWAIGISRGATDVVTIKLLPETLGIGDLAFGDCIRLEHLYYMNASLLLGDRSVFVTPELIEE